MQSTQHVNTTVHLASAKREQISTRIIFFIAGFVTAAWAAIVPYVKVNTGANDATLGMLLLCFGGGALVAMPVTGALAAKYGCRRLMVIATIGFCLFFPILSSLSQINFIIIALLLFGIFIGLTDCAMNVQAVIVEKSSDKP
ncbi:MFS transporter, partial [Providencia rettgeri]